MIPILILHLISWTVLWKISQQRNGGIRSPNTLQTSFTLQVIQVKIMCFVFTVVGADLTHRHRISSESRQGSSFSGLSVLPLAEFFLQPAKFVIHGLVFVLLPAALGFLHFCFVKLLPCISCQSTSDSDTLGEETFVPFTIPLYCGKLSDMCTHIQGSKSDRQLPLDQVGPQYSSGYSPPCPSKLERLTLNPPPRPSLFVSTVPGLGPLHKLQVARRAQLVFPHPGQVQSPSEKRPVIQCQMNLFHEHCAARRSGQACDK